MSLESSWSGTGWQDWYWSFRPVDVTLVKPDTIVVLKVICPFTGVVGRYRPAHLGNFIRRLSTADHGVTHHRIVPM